MRIRWIVFLIVLIIAFSCTNNQFHVFNDSGNKKSCSLTINFSQSPYDSNINRTVVSDFSTVTWTAKLETYNPRTLFDTSPTITNGTHTFNSVPIGKWVVTIEGKDGSSHLIATGSSVVDHAGSDQTVTIDTDFLQTSGVLGGFSLTLKYPMSTGIDSVTTGTIDSKDVTKSSIANDGTNYTVTLSASDIQSGSYSLFITFKKGTADAGVFCEAINIWDYTTSDKWLSGPNTFVSERVFTADEFFVIGSKSSSGGIIFYDKGYVSNGWRYLEAWTTDSAQTAYGCDQISSGATASNVGSGKINTQKIKSFYTTPSVTPLAANIATSAYGNYSDWFLPSTGELSLMHENLYNKSLGNFTQNREYWSSTEVSENTQSVYAYGFSSSTNQYVPLKGSGYTYYVRPIRAFRSLTDNKQTYIVTYNANGAESGTVPTNNYYYQTGETVDVSGDAGSLTKSGFTFIGWNTKADGSGTHYAVENTITMGSSNITLYAQWVASTVKTISSAVDLAKIGNAGYPAYTLGGSYILTADIDLSGYPNWTPIGTNTDLFTGVFDGNGHKIDKLKIDNSATYSLGLFAYSSGTVKNTILTNVDVKKTNNTEPLGSLIGKNAGTVTNCHVISGSVSGNEQIGGLIGRNINGGVSICSASCTVTGTTGTGTGNYIGGLIGNIAENPPNINNCYATGNVTGNLGIGGLIGYNNTNYGTTLITNCYATGNVTGASNLGGLVGVITTGSVNNSYYDKTTSDPNDTGKGTLRTTSEMKDQATYQPGDPNNWDFTTIWGINGTINNGYPYLLSNYISSYTVTYDANGNDTGTVPAGTHNYLTGQTVTVSGNTGSLTKAGYIFAGWNTKADGSGTHYNAGSGTLLMPANNVNLYARWVSQTEMASVTGGTANNFLLAGRTVNLSPFKMGKFEVTYKLWYQVKTWATDSARGANIYSFGGGYSGEEGSTGNTGSPTSNRNLPVTQIDPETAVLWCNAYTEYYNATNGQSLKPVYYDNTYSTILRSYNASFNMNLYADGFRLPTYAEWHFTARGGNPSDSTNWNYTYSGSNTCSDVAVYNNSTDSADVGTKAPNSLGIYDMSGNVWEIIEDKNGSLTTGTFTDPVINSGTYYYLNGGGYNSGTGDTKISTYNVYSSPSNAYGFRVCQSTSTDVYKIIYDANGGSGTVPVDNVFYKTGNTGTLKSGAALTNGSLTFAGWNTQSDGLGTHYAEGSTITMGSSNITLFAKWSP